MPSRPAARTRAPARRRRFAPTNLLTSLVLILPLLVFYEIGVMFSSTMNGADLITSALLRLVGQRGFLWVQLGLIVCLVGLVIYLRRTQQFELRQFVPVLLESGCYALLLGTLIVFVMVDVLHVDPRLAAGARGALAATPLFDKLVLSVGAGVHEELVFRLLLFGGLSAIAQRVMGLSRLWAIFLALLLSSVLFSAAHHLGPLGEPLRAGVFVYRALAGVAFAAIFHFRSLAIAVYTHALYDIYVMIIR